MKEEEANTGRWGPGGLIFLDAHTFILVNKKRGCLDVIHIPLSLPEPWSQQPRTAFTRLMFLSLPQLRPGWSYLDARCMSNPNPVGAQTDRIKQLRTGKTCLKPFKFDPEKAIVQLLFMVSHEVFHDDRIHFSLSETRDYSLVVHRSTLLRHVHKAHPWLLSNSSLPQEMHDSDPVTLAWVDWGLTSIRWHSGDEFCSTSTAGQRQVFWRAKKGPTFHIVVRDFNPIAVRRAIWEEKNGIFDSRKGRRRLITDSGPTKDWDIAFASEGSSSLHCIELEVKKAYSFGGPWMDETHLLGVHRSAESPLERPFFDSFSLFTF